MASVELPKPEVSDLYITAELDRRLAAVADHRRETLAVLELAARMSDDAEIMLPRFVELAMEIAGATSAGVSLYEADPEPGVFRWRYLRGVLAQFDGATTPRNFSPCGVTLDQNRPVLSRHPERAYDWIANANIVVPEVLLVPLRVEGSEPVGTLWVVSEKEGHFHREHARAIAELASFVGIALRVLRTESQLQQALEDQQTLAKEMSHRVKNMFAVTDGLIRMSARDAASKEELVEAISGRLHALASAHSLVSRHLLDVGHVPRTGNLNALLSAVTAPHESLRTTSAPKFRIAGPPIPCGDRALNGFAMVFHELATNAAKYGALSVEGGRVDVSWSQEGDELVIVWTEQGGPRVVAPPEQEGFGSSLVKMTVAHQLGGSLTRSWSEEGLKATMRIDLQRVGV